MSLSLHVHIGSLRKLHRIKGRAVRYGSKETKGPERLMPTNFFLKSQKNLPIDLYIILHDQL